MKTLPRATLAALLVSSLPAAAQAPLYDIRGAAGDRFAWSATGISDLNGDGIRDLIVGAPYSDVAGPDFGAVHLLSGYDAQGFGAIGGEAGGDAFGFSVDAVGDLDGDGVEDFVVGAPYHDSPGYTDDGRVYLYSGATLQLLQFHDGGLPNAKMGWSVAGVDGDMIGSSALDFAAGAPGASNSKGFVKYFDGVLKGNSISAWGTQDGGQFGWSVDAAGDPNNDTWPEMVVGAPTEDYNGWTSNGAAYVIRFSTVLYSLRGIGNNAQMGTSVAGLGDASGDGIDDFVFGESGSSAGAFDGGQLHLVSGAWPYATLWTATGEAYSKLGYAVAGIGDADGDGLGDLIAGAPFSDAAGFDRGRADVLSGLDGSTLATQFGYANDDEMGRMVSGVGDLNGDGFGDWVSGAPMTDVPWTDAGWAHFALSSQPIPQAYCTAKVNSAGCAPTIGFVGCPSASVSNYFQVLSGNVLPNKPGLMIWAYGQAAIPFKGGTLCLAPPVKRTSIQVSQDLNGGPCGGVFDTSFNHADMAANGMTAGTTFNAQYWYRDPGYAAPNDVGLSPGLAITILP